MPPYLVIEPSIVYDVAIFAKGLNIKFNFGLLGISDVVGIVIFYYFVFSFLLSFIKHVINVIKHSISSVVNCNIRRVVVSYF